jgi:hypothetical protein
MFGLSVKNKLEKDRITGAESMLIKIFMSFKFGRLVPGLQGHDALERLSASITVFTLNSCSIIGREGLQYKLIFGARGRS